MSEVEALIGSKKKEVENLVVEMKDANLASLSMTLLPSPASADDTHDTGGFTYLWILDLYLNIFKKVTSIIYEK